MRSISACGFLRGFAGCGICGFRVVSAKREEGRLGSSEHPVLWLGVIEPSAAAGGRSLFAAPARPHCPGSQLPAKALLQSRPGPRASTVVPGSISYFSSRPTPKPPRRSSLQQRVYHRFSRLRYIKGLHVHCAVTRRCHVSLIRREFGRFGGFCVAMALAFKFCAKKKTPMEHVLFISSYSFDAGFGKYGFF